MNDFEILRPEVREAVHAIDHGNGVFVDSDDSIGAEKWRIVRAELLRLADERHIAIAELQYHKQLLAVEAELAALKARIADGAHRHLPSV